jgi:osmoprotectant transport system permease protein
MTVALAWEILQRCGEHLLMVALAVAIALAIALPLGVAIQGRPRCAQLVLGLANAVQTIPSLAIFGLLLTVPVLGGIGPTPAVVALILYALLPLLRGLVTGLSQVPPGLKEAGRALGLSPAQVLRHVELPLALPSLMAGLRVATVISVGVATIGAAIGAGGLGVFIFRGIATVNNTLLLAGPCRRRRSPWWPMAPSGPWRNAWPAALNEADPSGPPGPPGRDGTGGSWWWAPCCSPRSWPFPCSGSAWALEHDRRRARW